MDLPKTGFPKVRGTSCSGPKDPRFSETPILPERVQVPKY